MSLELLQKPGVRMHVHMPNAVVGRWENGEEVGNRLPPFAPIKAHCVDDYPNLPADWARSDDEMRSYVIGLTPGKGMWFDFRELMSLDHDMAVRLSVQGICALTGHPTDVENGGDGMHLIQFRNNCLRHPDVAFGPDRFCAACGNKWPKQNYLSTTCSDPRHGVVMWIDGFRATDGKVRQYLVTRDASQGVAFQLLGERRTFHHEVALYEGVHPKPPSSRFPGGYMLESAAGPPHSFGGGMTKGIGGGAFRGTTRGFDASASPMRSAQVERLEIGAGAIINQTIGDDPNPIEYWKPRPVGRFRIYYMNAQQLSPILAAGRADAQRREGFLGGIRTVGNPPAGGGNTTT